MSESRRLDASLLRRFPLPSHAPDVDKDARGLALCIVGSRETAGAAMLAGLGALRAGAGKLRIAAPASIAAGLGIAVPEARVIAFAEDARGCIDRPAVDELIARCAGSDSVTIGPGMQRGDALGSLVEAAFEGAAPLVLDAAALGVLRPLAAKLRVRPSGTILLPHAGEMARLLGWERARVEADPLAAAIGAAETYGSVVVIKGEYSFIVAPDGAHYRFRGGGIGLATSGSGDVLAGIVGGLAARGADAVTAALWGVYLHGEAGRMLGKQVGTIGFLARELLDVVPGLME